MTFADAVAAWLRASFAAIYDRIFVQSSMSYSGGDAF
jgi:hypothetical protein